MNIINKHPIAVEIIKDNLTEQEAFYWEEKIIETLVFEYGYSIDIPNNRSKEKGMHLVNCTWGGEGTSGMNPFENMTEEEKKERGNRISKANRGKKRHSKETKKRISVIKKNWWSSLTEEEYEKYLENRPNYKEGNNPSARRVICLNTNEIFECLRSAANKYNTKGETIGKCCKGEYKTAGGVVWMYYDEYLITSKEEILQRLTKGEEKIDRTGKNNPMAKSIICLNDKRIFLTTIDASEYYNISNHSINKVLKGKNKNCGKKVGKKLIFKYLVWNHNKKFRIK